MTRYPKLLALAAVIAIALCLCFPMIRDVIAHNLALSKWESKVDALQLEQFGKVVFRHSDLGLLFGNGNHTDYWVVRIVEVSGSADQAIEQISERITQFKLPEMSVSKPATEFPGDHEFSWRKLGVYDRFLKSNNIVVVQFFAQDAAGNDPRSH